MPSELITEYKRCVAALEEAERDLNSDNPKNLFALESMLSSGSPAMRMLQRHHSYGPRLQGVVGKLREYKARLPVEPVTDAEMISGNWADCVLQSNKNNREIANARQIAELRMKHGKDSDYCTKGSWVGENFNYLPNGDILVASRNYNPLLKYAEEATKAHIAGKEFYLDDKIVAELLAVEKQGGVLLLKRKDVTDTIAIDSFGKEPLTAFLGWNKDYGEFLNSCEIKKVRLYVVNKQSKAFSRALLANNLGNYSALYGYNYLYFNLGDGGRAFGVRRRGER